MWFGHDADPKNISSHAKLIKRARHLASTFFFFYINRYEIQFCLVGARARAEVQPYDLHLARKPVHSWRFSVKVTVTHSVLRSYTSNFAIRVVWAITAMMSSLETFCYISCYGDYNWRREKPVLASASLLCWLVFRSVCWQTLAEIRERKWFSRSNLNKTKVSYFFLFHLLGADFFFADGV